ncbi:MAG: hypothetical protein WEB30_04000 [Cyclobacteriaceae bacterium]
MSIFSDHRSCWGALRETQWRGYRESHLQDYGFLIPEKFKAIEGGKVAEAMLTFASADERGMFIQIDGPELAISEIGTMIKK